jgi:eukaryotic-like serine/threonine-protein kinase
MLRDLETCLLPERRTESKLAFIEDHDEDSTRIIPAIRPQNQGSPAGSSKLSRDGRDGGVMVEERDSAQKKKVSGRPALWVSLTLVVLLALAGVAWYVTSLVTVPEVAVPNVLNLEEEKAVQTLTAEGIAVGDITREYKEGVDEGIVYEQSKPEGTMVKEGSAVDLKVSIEKPLSPMPELTGTYDDALQQLKKLGVDQARVTKVEENNAEVEPGMIISQSPEAGEEFDPETVNVVLKVSKGPSEVKMPDLVNKTQAEAEKLIRDAGLELAEDGIKEEPSFEVDAGKVTKQWPYSPDELVAPGSKVTLFISTGYPPEAINYTFQVPAAPAQEGQISKYSIVYGDARGEGREWGTQKVGKAQYLAVDLVLAPNKNGYVTVTRDGVVLDTYPISYIDAKQGTVPVPQFPDTGGTDEDTMDMNSGDNPPDTGMILSGKLASLQNEQGSVNGKGKAGKRNKHGN